MLVEICIIIETEEKLEIVKEDPSDNIIMESAVEGKADFIVSGDQHLLKLKEYKGIKILTPREFLDLT
ncbi:MAG: putative toxin-antitoxin system toxin component, PIN family [Nanoarchaeota archaeon]|nr:putative toxin-antitoxin system toxin component, PIN family [Nanoarchaeota archaeon]